jgi:putative glutamine amidotransferase
MNNFKLKILIPLNNPPKTYLKALRLVGLEPICKFNPQNLDEFSGLLLTGGGDILPSLYKKFNLKYFNVNPIRDVNELNILDVFYKRNLPILGVCRGLQLINVYFGGTLKNVDGHLGVSGYCLKHEIISPPNGFLKRMIKVNSFHHQAVDTLCESAENVCFSTDNVIEGFSINEKIFAVQFHPERMGTSAILAVYGAFAKAVKDCYRY